MPTGEHLQRYTQADYATIRRLHDQGLSQGKIARRIGVSQCHVGRVLRGEVRAAGAAVIEKMVSPLGTRNGLSTTPPKSQR